MSSPGSLNTDEYLPSIILETLKVFAKHGDRGIRSDMLVLSVTIEEKIAEPPFQTAPDEVVYQVHDRTVKTFVIFSQDLELKLQSRNHTCTRLQPALRSLANHLLNLLDFSVELRRASAGATTTIVATDDRIDVGRCPLELQLIFRAIDATCSCLKKPNTDSQASLDRSVWYYSDPDADNIIAKIIARDEQRIADPNSVNRSQVTDQERISEPEPPPRKKPRMLIINFEENNNYTRSHIPDDASSLDSYEDSTSWPFTDNRGRRSTEAASSGGSLRSHVSETPPYAIPRLVVRETPRTSLESQSSAHGNERLLSQGFANGSFSDYGTPNSSGSEFGGSILLQCISEAKREVAARERLQRCKKRRIVVDETDEEDYEQDLGQSF